MASEDWKPVKKEEESGNKSSVSKKVAKVKKEEGESVKKETKAVTVKKEVKVKKEINDDLPLARRTSNSKEVNKKKKIKEKVKEEEEKKKRQKKVYDLPGQKRDPPEEKDPLRIFYESLYAQIPHSEMSQIWLMESGLLPKEVARKVFEKKQKKCPQKLSSPVKVVSAVKSTTKSVTVKKKNPTSPLSSLKKNTTKSTSKQSSKRKYKASSEDDDDTDSDEEFILSVAKRRKMA